MQIQIQSGNACPDPETQKKTREYYSEEKKSVTDDIWIKQIIMKSYNILCVKKMLEDFTLEKNISGLYLPVLVNFYITKILSRKVR